MSKEQTTALICFSGPRDATGSHVQLCLGTEGDEGQAPFAFTITIASITAQGASVNVTERIPLSHADIQKLRGWINMVDPAGR
ncbi:hypothetical protein [Paraliomyxa miuraensis]|uniref:hypothetical protein n=1 Tax=Paraliomyxa miuraensis TaxID=376150 RepID=UPI0022567113|nr:hypothetical protein [Paraliomyxa miuraensis]MCX4241115.1 hypothetical protein [Paraliomyxa miuraensis]